MRKNGQVTRTKTNFSWKAPLGWRIWMLEADYKNGTRLNIVPNARSWCQLCCNFRLQYQCWLLASSHAKSDSYFRRLCPSTFITATPIQISWTWYFVLLLKYADTILISVKVGQKWQAIYVKYPPTVYCFWPLLIFISTDAEQTVYIHWDGLFLWGGGWD